MFDVGWSEMAIIALVALLVFGPKELPNALRTGAKWMKNARKIAREFQSGVDQIVREADLEDARKIVTDVKRGGVSRAIEKSVDPEGDLKQALDSKEIEREADAGIGAKVKPAEAPKPLPPKIEAPAQTESAASTSLPTPATAEPVAPPLAATPAPAPPAEKASS